MAADASIRLVATGAAVAELERLRERYGPLILFQSGGCCDGSSPICLVEGDLRPGQNDLFLGEVAGCPFYVDRDLYARWREPSFLLDLSPGAGSGLSLEGVDDVQFVTRDLPEPDATR
jgi:uncharacterized protein